jgi:16S rRNA (uracil1498-N3)-methyltransferase
LSKHRFYIEDSLQGVQSASLSKEEEHHLRHVMRVKKGDLIELVDGKGTLASGVFSDPFVSITSVHTSKAPVDQAVLLQAMTEPSKLEWIVEKGTELGITSFWLFPAKKSKLSSLSDSKKERLEKILISALKQSDRLYLPKIHYVTSMDRLPTNIPNLYLAHKGGLSPSHIQKGSSGILVGPESGFTEEEASFFQHTLGAIPITLSENVLRAETAAMIASFLIS